MAKLKFYLRDILYFYLYLFLILMILTFLNYVNLINYKLVSIIGFVITVILFFYSSIKVARKSERKGYRSGLTFSSLNILIFIFLSLLLGAKMNWSVLIYYLILLVSGILGGMIGINIKKK